MTYGPIDMIALEFESDQLKGEILPELMELAEKKIVRIIDLVIVQKYADGEFEALEMEELGDDLIAIFDPLNIEVSGIIQEEDIEAIAEAMEDDTTVAVLLFENLWAVKFKEAVLRAEGKLLMQERIPDETIQETLEIFAQEEGE